MHHRLDIHDANPAGLKAVIALTFIFISLLSFGQKNLYKADDLFDQGQYQKALNFYIQHESTLTDSIQKHPVLVKIAACYTKMNNSDKAANYYSMAVAIRDNLNEEHKINYVNSLIETSLYSKARDYLINMDDGIYFDNILIQVCDYALKYPTVDEAVQLNAIYRQYGDEVFGISLMDNNLLYTVPGISSNRKQNNTYLYSPSTEASQEYIFSNDALQNAVFYTPCYDSKSKLLYYSRNLSDKNKYYESIREELKIGVGGSNNLGIYVLNLDKNNKKARPELLPFINYDYNTTHPFISEDGNTLYFTSDVPGGFGGYDIYYAQKNGDTWSRPVNMGAKFNTILNEGYPFLKGDKLYFSSTGHPGYGGLDIYVCDLKTMKVENIGKPINSSYDDFYIAFTELEKGFILSNRNRNDGRDIIYYFEDLSPKQ